MYIPVILGTSREGRQSEKVANIVLSSLKNKGIDSEIIDTRDYNLSVTDNRKKTEKAIAYAEKIIKAKSIIIVSPEYNHGFSGELKMLLDLAYKEYFGKKVGICGVSMGPLGGARGVQLLKLVCAGLNMYTVIENVYFANVFKVFDDKGNLLDKSYEDKIDGMIKALSS